MTLNTYSLERLGYDVPVTGDALRDQLAAESMCFRIAHPPQYGGLGKFGHFRRIVDLLWNNPELDSRKRFVWNRWSERFLRAACEHDELGVAGCASSGKCFDPNTLVLRHDGTAVRALEVKVGESLVGDDGTPRIVREVHLGHGSMYRIRAGGPIPDWECSGYHVLVLRDLVREKTVEMSLKYYLRHFSHFGGRYAQILRSHDGTFRCEPIHVTPLPDGPWVGFSLDGNKRHVLANGVITHNSDPAALWTVVNYITDPTHTLAIVMSTQLAGAKKRIWKTLREYWEAIDNLPGKPSWSLNEIRGLAYDGRAYGQSSGIYLLASEQSSEKTALDKLIGIKAPRTGFPDDTFDALAARPEFADLVRNMTVPALQELLPRLVNLSEDRIGELILSVDEATGCAPSILHVARTNMKPGNAGHFQCIMLGNPNSHYDTFGDFCTPEHDWPSVSLADDEWTTATGGLVVRFNAEESPRILDGRSDCSWMPPETEILKMEKTYGRDSLFFYRMVLGFWSPKGSEAGIYTEADMIQGGASGKATWGLHSPTKHSALDPAFTNGGDRASCTFFAYGKDMHGKQVLERQEEITIKADIKSEIPVSTQLVRQWRDECHRRGVPPENACFDSTGGGITFADVVRTHWSNRVQPITSAGKASKTPIGIEKNPETGKPVLACERYANAATEIWYGAHPYLRSGQLKGLDADLIRELCSRRNDDKSVGRLIKVESKRQFKSRVGNSPDGSDSWLLGVHHVRTRHGFRPAEGSAEPDKADAASRSGKPSTWRAFQERARRLTRAIRLPKNSA